MEHRLFFSTVAISTALNEVESTLSVNYLFLQDMHIPRICVRGIACEAYGSWITCSKVFFLPRTIW